MKIGGKSKEQRESERLDAIDCSLEAVGLSSLTQGLAQRKHR